MQWFFLLTALLAHTTYAARYLRTLGSYDAGAGTLTLNLDIVPNGDNPISFLGIWTQLTDSYPSKTSDVCRTDSASTPKLIMSSFLDTGLGVNVQRVVVKITGDNNDPNNEKFSNEDGIADLLCGFTYNDVSNEYGFIVRVFETAVAAGADPSPIPTDREFVVSVDADTISSGSPPQNNGVAYGSGTAWTPNFIVNTVTENQIALTLEVLDYPGLTPQTQMELGKAAQLSLTMTSDPHEVGLSYAGARVLQCMAAKDGTFSPNIVFLGNVANPDGCFISSSLFDGVRTDKGFDFVVTSQTGTTLTVIARSDVFEMAGIYHADTSAAESPLFIRCTVSFCYDTAANSDGECGGNHCLMGSGRRKRSVDKSRISHVTTMITIRPKANTTSQCRPDCAETAAYKGVMVTLTTIGVILFGVMVNVYNDVSNTFIRLRRESEEKKAGAWEKTNLITLATNDGKLHPEVAWG